MEIINDDDCLYKVDFLIFVFFSETYFLYYFTLIVSESSRFLT